ncbi:MAG: energy transducer TonB [Alphaproteobacteria bacterium]
MPINVPLSEFSHRHGPDPAGTQSRIVAGALTGLLYALFGLLAWWSLQQKPVPRTMEITATLLADTPNKHVAEPLPAFMARLIRPQAEMPALPVFTIASGAPPQAPAPLAATAKISPMLGGTSGTGDMGQAASGDGTGGNGGALAGCLDPAWLRAVTERVRQFYYYPDAALAVHRTGVVTVHFAVRRDGKIDRLSIARSSGDEGLDKAAIDILRKSQPLPPIPDRMHVDRVAGDLPVNFGVRNFAGNTSLGTCGS